MMPIRTSMDNAEFGPPKEWPSDELACQSVGAIVGMMPNLGPVVITCWMPSKEEVLLLTEGHPISLYVYGKGLPPHSLAVGLPQLTHTQGELKMPEVSFPSTDAQDPPDHHPV